MIEIDGCWVWFGKPLTEEQLARLIWVKQRIKEMEVRDEQRDD